MSEQQQLQQKGYIRFYEDRECTKPLAILGFGDVETGTRQQRWIYCRNEGERQIDELIIQTEDPDLKVLDYPPKELIPGEIYPIVFEFSPQITRQQPLNTRWKVIERYVAKRDA